MSEQEYLQTTRDTITSPSIIAELQQHGGPTWVSLEILNKLS